MIRIGVPKSFGEIAPFFTGEHLKKDLYMAAWDDGRPLAACRFKYKEDWVSIFEIVEIDPGVPGAVLDGLVRNVLFQTADVGCEACRLYDFPKRMRGYFENHGFVDRGDCLEHPAYVDAFFKPCPGCAHEAQ
ncbi:MAG: hypothetical protein Q4C55_06800 [Eubacterium sp.]|nr:hypothetical protein [Eubacterium sp.]